METSLHSQSIFIMEKNNFAINGGNESIALAVVNVLINGEVKEVLPAFTKFSIRRRNLSKTMESVDKTKILPTLFGFAKASIFRAEGVTLKDFYGNEIPSEVDEQTTVLVYLDKSDNLNLFECSEEPLKAEMVECENVADAYNRVSTSFVLSQLPQKDEWVGLCEATTSDNVLSQIREFANTHKVNGTVAQSYFGLRYTIADLKKSAVSKTSPLGDETTFRSKDDAERLYSAASEYLTVRAANQTRIARSLNSSVQKYSVEDVVSALGDMRLNDQKAIIDAPCEERGDNLLAYIAEWMGRRSATAA